MPNPVDQKKKEMPKDPSNSMERYRVLFESIRQGVVSQDQDGKIVLVNPAAERILGMPFQEMKNKTSLDPRLQTIHEDGSDFPMDMHPGWIALKTGQNVKGTVMGIFNPREGRQRWLNVSAVPIITPGGKHPIRAYMIFDDITDLKQTQLQLKESEERYQSMLENMIDGYFEVDLNGNFLFFNQALLEISGYSSNKLSKMNFRELMDQENAQCFFEAFNQVFVTGQPEKGHVGELIRKGGDKRIVEVSSSLLIGPDGEKWGFQGIARDITEQRSFGKEKERLEEELRQFQKLEAIGRLAGGVAHDFNNLLTGISGYAQLLLPKAEDHPVIQRGLKQISDLSDRAADLTRQLLAFSRKQPLSSVVVNMNALIENLSRMLRRIIGEDIVLKCVLAPELWNVSVDPGQMEQILMNLTVNARDAMPQGGEIIIKTSNIVLDQKFAKMHVGVKSGFYIELMFSDTGKGMDKATQERIFEPFFTTKEPGKGTGLGLSTVYGIIKQHKGNIWVRSKISQGTTFEIFLPRAAGPAAELGRKRDTKIMPKGTETILVVEDEEAVRNFVHQVLEGQGYRVFTAPSPEEAKEIFERKGWEVALLLTDVVMPGENGFELYKKLTSRRPSLKVLYMSGYAMDTLIQEGEMSPDIPILQKPFPPKVLTNKIREILDA